MSYLSVVDGPLSLMGAGSSQMEKFALVTLARNLIFILNALLMLIWFGDRPLPLTYQESNTKPLWLPKMKVGLSGVVVKGL